MTLSAADVMKLAEQQVDAGDLNAAETLLQALTGDTAPDVRNEARFRLGMMLAYQQGRYREAAIQFRTILDDRPEAVRVRLELARIHALSGNTDAAAREFRAAHASGLLPPEAGQAVRFFANALASRRLSGMNFELALAPDSNINRATRDNQIDTVLGPFELDDNARSRSGLGIAARGQAFRRIPLTPRLRLLASGSGSANLYQKARFNDISAGLRLGLEFGNGDDRFTVTSGPAWRWFGGVPYSHSLSVAGAWYHPLSRTRELRLEATLGRNRNQQNPLQSSSSFGASLGLDQAFSTRNGAGIQIAASRDAARDPGYSTSQLEVSAYFYQELGPATAIATVRYGVLAADARLLLYPSRRSDKRTDVSAGWTLRSLQIAGSAPYLRIRWEQNRSSLALYRYRRLAGEIGLSRAF